MYSQYTTLLTTEYYSTFSFPFTHTEREKMKKKKEKKRKRKERNYQLPLVSWSLPRLKFFLELLAVAEATITLKKREKPLRFEPCFDSARKIDQ